MTFLKKVSIIKLYHIRQFLKGRALVSKVEYIQVLKNCKLFREAEDSTLEMAQSLCEEMTLEKNEVLEMSEGIYIIISGKLGVYHSENGKNVLFNTLNPSEAFGYASLFSSDSEDAYTQIKAGKSRARMLFMNSESVEKLVLAEPRIALCIIKELTGKIRFLNKKLDSFVTSDLKHRLMKYITSLSYNDEGRARIPVSMSALAGRLGVGRASLYRLMSELTREGVIERQGNEIILKKTAE